MKIISQLDTRNWSLECKCGHCESKLEINATDIRHSHSEGDGIYPASDSYSVQCPVCVHYINVPATDIPKVVQLTAQKSSRSSSYFDR
jgi:hypothetical protein